MENNFDKDGNLVLDYHGYEVKLVLGRQQIILIIGGTQRKSFVCQNVQAIIKAPVLIEEYISFAKSEIEAEIRGDNPRQCYSKIQTN